MIDARHGLPIGGALMGLCALALVAVIAALVIEGRPATAVPTPFDPAPIATVAPPEQSPAPSGGEVTADEADAVLSAYVEAYAAEDPSALASLMTTDIVRANGDEAPVEGANAVAAVYAEQFDALETPRYSFDVETFEPSGDEALVSGVYTIESAAAEPSTGGVAFHMLRVDGELLIDRIDVVPVG